MLFKKMSPIMFFTKSSSKMFLIAKRAFSIFFMELMTMFSIFSKNKVFNSIILFISVNMVNLFSFFKISPNMLFHYKTMLKNISIAFTKWMVCLSNKNITIMNSFSTFPVASFISIRHIFKVALMTHFGFISSFFFSFTRKIPIFTTDNTFGFNHNLILTHKEGY